MSEKIRRFFEVPADAQHGDPVYAVVDQDRGVLFGPRKQARRAFLSALSEIEETRRPVPATFSDATEPLEVRIVSDRYLADYADDLAMVAGLSTISGIRGNRVAAVMVRADVIRILVSRDVWFNERRVTRGFPGEDEESKIRFLEDLASRIPDDAKVQEVIVDDLVFDVRAGEVRHFGQQAEEDDAEEDGRLRSVLEEVADELRRAGREIERAVGPIKDRIVNSPRTAAGLGALADGLRSVSGKLGDLAERIERK